MPVNFYETMIIFDSAPGNTADAAKANVVSILEKHQVEILAARKWGDDRKLAYAIDKQKKGQYYLTFYKADSSKIDAIELDLKLSEYVLRYMTQRIPTKWIEEFTTVAQDPNGTACQIMRDEEQTPMMGIDFDSEMPPRRNRRSEEHADKM